MAQAPSSSGSRRSIATLQKLSILLLVLVLYSTQISGAGSASATISASLTVTNGNIIVEGLSVSPSSAALGDQLTIMANIINDGSTATTNMIFNMKAVGPATVSISQSLPSLSPSQSEIVSISASGFTSAAGIYTMLANVSFNALLSNGLISNTAQTSFTVIGSGGGGGGSGTPPITNPILPPTSIAAITFPEMPIYVSVIGTNSSISQMAIQNNGNNYVWVNLTTSPLSYGYLTFSTSSLYIPPQQTVLINVVFKPNFGAPSATFLAPINFSVTAVGAKPTTAESFLSIRIKNSSTEQPIFTRTTTLQNYSKQILTQLHVYNPTNQTIYDSVITTSLPSSVAKQLTQFVLSGGLNNVTLMDNEYILTWKISALQPKSDVFLYYAVNNVTEPQFFTEPITSFSVPTQVSGDVKIYNIEIPTFYTNKSQKISVSSLYIGTNYTNVTFQLTGPPTVVIPVPSITYQAAPNTAMAPSFNISGISESGTYILQLTVRAAGKNQSYSLPVVVLSQQQLQTAPETTIPSATAAVFPSTARVYLALAVLAIAAIWGAAELLRRSGKGRYSDDRAKKLIRMREQMKRTGDSNE